MSKVSAEAPANKKGALSHEVRSEDVAPLQVLSPEGEVVNPERMPKLSDEQLKEIMYRMVFTRTWDDRAVNLGRQGRLGFYAPVSGQEAIDGRQRICSEQRRFHLPGLPRYAAARMARLAAVSSIPVFPRSSAWRTNSGRCSRTYAANHYRRANSACYGCCDGLQVKGEKRVAITYTGDGGSSEGDFYEGMNFAGAFKLPVIYFVQNNGYAITTPFAKQTAALSIAHKAVAAGIRGVQVDGMDVLAVI